MAAIPLQVAPAPAVLGEVEPKPTVPEPTYPYPPRRWWLKRVAASVAAIAVALVLLRLGWGWDADRHLRRVVEPLRADGRPLRVEELAPPPVRPDQNGAAYLKAAIAAIDPRNECPASTSISYPDYPPFGSAWETLASKSVAASAKTFPLARKARAFDQFDWGTQYKRPGIAVLLPHLNQARELANTLGDAALYAHVHGDDAAALETIRDLRHTGRGLEGEHFLVSGSKRSPSSGCRSSRRGSGSGRGAVRRTRRRCSPRRSRPRAPLPGRKCLR